MKKMRGLYMVEFAIVGSLLMMLLFGCLEFGLATYSMAALNEGTRRAARLAAVCPINNGTINPVNTITSAVNFMNVPGFNTATNVQLNYLDATGATLAAPTLGTVYYVQVSVINYTVPLAIPGLNTAITSPAFTVTLPAESLGVSNAGSAAC
jgi:Flp pilus assembly protein TadG